MNYVLLIFFKIFNYLIYYKYWKNIMGIGDWGLGPIPNPQSPIPNPQSPFNQEKIKEYKIKYIFIEYKYIN